MLSLSMRHLGLDGPLSVGGHPTIPAAQARDVSLRRSALGRRQRPLYTLVPGTRPERSIRHGNEGHLKGLGRHLGEHPLAWRGQHPPQQARAPVPWSSIGVAARHRSLAESRSPPAHACAPPGTPFLRCIRVWQTPAAIHRSEGCPSGNSSPISPTATRYGAIRTTGHLPTGA